MKLKILAIHSAYHPDQNKRSAVDAWRLARPLAELRKHVDWQIDERISVIPDLTRYKDAKDFSQEEMEAAFTDICSYDIVISTYQSNPTIYTLLKVAEQRAGTQYIIDCDDDMFAINPDNPVWMAVTDENIYHMQRMIADVTWLSTTTPVLAKAFRDRRKGHSNRSVFINPNYITDEYQHPEFDNGDKVVIGFVGGSSHYGDLHRTGVLEAIQKLMHENKHVHYKSVGMLLDSYLPKARVHIDSGKKGDAFLHGLYPELQFDISIGPLEDNIFNRGKSNIKWQESTRAGAAFVCSDVGPYQPLSSLIAGKVKQNTADDWYEALKPLVDSQQKRQRQVAAARQTLVKSWRLEDHWQPYKEMFEMVHASSQVPVAA